MVDGIWVYERPPPPRADALKEEEKFTAVMQEAHSKAI